MDPALHRFREPAVRALSRMLPFDVLCFVDTDASAVALTFDDGPHPATTPPLLDVLATHRAHATFFLIGDRIPGHEPILSRIAADGHELANHGMREERAALLPDGQLRRDLAAVNALLAPYGRPRWYRPGAGWFTPRMLRSAALLDLRVTLGTAVATNTGGTGDAGIAGSLLAGLRPGSILVLHEGTPARHGVAATTDEVLTGLACRGLAAVTVSELVALARM